MEKEKWSEYYKIFFFELIKELNPYEFSKYIDFYCPIFDDLLKKEYFGTYFTILLKMEYIHKNVLIEDYTKYFEKLNNSNEKYSYSIFVILMI